MSLKHFHLIFVNAALLLAGWFGGWSWGQYKETGSGLGYVIGAGVVALALLVYEVWFFRKSKRLNLE